MRIAALPRRIDDHLRTHMPGLWALRIHRLFVPTICVMALSVGLHLVRWPGLWHPLDGRLGAILTLVATSVFATAWVHSTVQSRRCLPVKYRLGWWLSPLTTMMLLAVALAAPTLVAALAAEAVNRTCIDRTTLIADARVLGHAYEEDGRTWVGDPPGRWSELGPVDNNRETRWFCRQATRHGQQLVTVAMKYLSPADQTRLRTPFADALAACARNEFAWDPLVTRVWFQLRPFAAAYDMSPYLVAAPRQAILIVLSLELALLGTVIATIAELSSWRRLGRVALGLVVMYYIFQTIAPAVLVERQAMFQTVIRVTLWCAGPALAGWSIAIAAGRLRRRSTLRDYLVNSLLAAPAFAAAMANSGSGDSLSFLERGWAASTLPLPADEPLQGGFLIALGFLAVTPLLHVFVEYYRTFREA